MESSEHLKTSESLGKPELISDEISRENHVYIHSR